MELRRDVFHAISDPTRREIISLLAGQHMNLNTLSEQFPVSRQAISLHVKILRECNLIAIRQEGRERICSVQWETLKEVDDWTSQFRSLWKAKLKALKIVVENQTKHTKS